MLRIGLDLSQNGYGWNYNAYREEHLTAYHAYRKEHAYNAYREEHLFAYNACRKEYAYNAYGEEHLSAYQMDVDDYFGSQKTLVFSGRPGSQGQ